MSIVDTAYAASDVAAGTAAEHLVTAALLLAGFHAFMAGSPAAPYDVALEALGRLLRVQVKATRSPRLLPQASGPVPAYCWDVRRTLEGVTAPYARGDFDLLALVALDTGQIAWVPPAQRRSFMSIRPDGDESKGKHFGDYELPAALKAMTPVRVPAQRRRRKTSVKA